VWHDDIDESIIGESISIGTWQYIVVFPDGTLKRWERNNGTGWILKDASRPLPFQMPFDLEEDWKGCPYLGRDERGRPRLIRSNERHLITKESVKTYPTVKVIDVGGSEDSDVSRSSSPPNSPSDVPLMTMSFS